MAIHIRRRELLVTLGGAAAWPRAARAQQPQRMRRIGVLMNLASDDAEGQAASRLSIRGYNNWAGQLAAMCRSTYRWGGGNADRIRKLAAELVALAPDVILSAGGPSVAAFAGHWVAGGAGRENYHRAILDFCNNIGTNEKLPGAHH